MEARESDVAASVNPLKRLLPLTLLLLALPVAAADTIMPLDEVTKGMKGYGLTVFDGNRVERFDVEILGVLRNIGPGQNLILAHVDSEVTDGAGIIAGMSGSPVYVDGKVIGALAYGWQFSRDSVGGITPIEDMLRIDSRQIARGIPASPISASEFVTFLSSGDPQPAFNRLTAQMSSATRAAGASGALPIATPLAIAGMSADTIERFRSVLGGAGLLPVPVGTTTGSSAAAVQNEPFRPGDTVSAVLVDGDFSLAANGTVTHVDGDRVYGFGHPFLDMGPVAFPMAKAEVVGVLPSLAQSFKFSNTGPVVGTFVQDRAAGILGLRGEAPRMVPVTLNLRAPEGESKFALRIVDDATLLPLLLAMSTDTVISGTQKAAGERTILMDLNVELENGKQLRIQEGWTGPQARGTIPMYLAVLLNYVTANPFEPAAVKSVTLDLNHSDALSSAQIIDATLVSMAADGRIRPGADLLVRTRIRPWRGETYTVELPLKVPADARPGIGHVVVSSGTIANQLQFSVVPPDPRGVDDLIQIVSQLRPATEVGARMLLPLDGRVTGGSYHPSLPPSMAAMIDDDASNSGSARVRLDPSRFSSRDIGSVVTGVTRIDFRIEPRS